MRGSRQDVITVALQEQQRLRKRAALLGAAREVLAQQRQMQLNAKLADKSEAAAQTASLRWKASEVRQQLSSGLEERRFRLGALFDRERGEAEARLQRMQHNVTLKEHNIMQRATALKDKLEKERDEEDTRLLAMRDRQQQEDLRYKEDKVQLLEVKC